MNSKYINRVLVTGGAGFIGSHVGDLLIESGYETTILDLLEQQVHGSGGLRPEYVNSLARFLLANVLERRLLDQLLPQVDAVVHLSALVGSQCIGCTDTQTQTLPAQRSFLMLWRTLQIQ